jgi:hypothetical protein
MNRAHVNLKEPPLAPEYEADFTLWAEHQELLLRERRFDLLDLDNLIDEVGDMGRSARRELRNRLRQLLLHLLKCAYQPAHQSGSWISTINEQRASIADLIADSPSLAPTVQAAADHAYRLAASAAAKETGLPRATFPPANPYTTEQLLDEDYFP